MAGPRVVHDKDKADETEIDPDLVRLKRRLPVGPVLAASVLGFALLLLIRLRADFAYAGRGDVPTDLGAATAPAPLVDNSFASLTGRPDAVAPVRLRGAQESGHRMAPFVGTSGRIWLEDSSDAGSSVLAFDARWSGRLRSLAGTDIGAELARHLAASPPVPRVVYPDALRGALPKVDGGGDALPLAPDGKVAVAIIVPDTARVLFVKTDDVPDEAAARAALRRIGFIPGPGDPVEKTEASWTFEIAAAPAAVNAALRAGKLFGAAASPRLDVAEGKVADLDVQPDDRIVLAGRAIPRAAVDRVTFWVQRSLPADAWVLVSGDTPAGLWYMRPLFAVLALFALLMMWALYVDLRQLRRRPPRPQLVT